MKEIKRGSILGKILCAVPVAMIAASVAVLCSSPKSTSINKIDNSGLWEPAAIEVLDTNINRDYEVVANHTINIQSKYNGEIINGTFSNLGTDLGIKAGDTLDGYVNSETGELAYMGYRTGYDVAKIRYMKYVSLCTLTLGVYFIARTVRLWIDRKRETQVATTA